MSNFPDDINQYSADPRSPFYKEWHCPKCGEEEGFSECTEDLCEEDTITIDGHKYRPLERGELIKTGDVYIQGGTAIPASPSNTSYGVYGKDHLPHYRQEQDND